MAGFAIASTLWNAKRKCIWAEKCFSHIIIAEVHTTPIKTSTMCLVLLLASEGCWFDSERFAFETATTFPTKLVFNLRTAMPLQRIPKQFCFVFVFFVFCFWRNWSTWSGKLKFISISTLIAEQKLKWIYHASAACSRFLSVLGDEWEKSVFPEAQGPRFLFRIERTEMREAQSNHFQCWNRS